MSAALLVIAAPLEFQDGLKALARFEAVCAALFSSNLIYFIYKKNFTFTIIFDVLVFSVLFFTIAYTKSSVQSLVWFLTLPVFVSLLLGLKLSIPINLVLSMVYLYLLNHINENSADFISITLGMLNFFSLAGVSLLHEFTRYSAGKEIEQISLSDTLTGVYNRKAFEKILSEEITRIQRKNSLLSVMLFDVDNYKEITKKYGFGIGDIFLVDIIKIFKQNLRPVDRIFRIANEGFAVIFTDTDGDAVKLLAERIQNTILNSEIAGIKNISFCAGVSICCQGDTVDTVFSRSKSALDIARSKGKGNIAVLSE